MSVPPDIMESVKQQDKWFRLLYMLLFFFIAEMVKTMLLVFSFGQFVLSLFDRPNGRLQDFARSLVAYQAEIFTFLNYNQDVKPFPFADWPEVK